MNNEKEIRYFSTFSGIGGFELGIERALHHRSQPAERDTAHEHSADRCGKQKRKAVQLSCVGSSEIDKYAAQIYQRHFPDHHNYGDITAIDAAALPDFDLYVGGFPCQAFSIAGKRGGFSDTRGTLFFDVARILQAKRPRHFLLENVKGLLSHDNGRTFQTIIAALVELGYGVEWQVLNSKDFGVPQNRERVFIVGHLGGEPARKVFPLERVDAQNTEPKPYAAGINNASRGYEIRKDGLGSCVRAGESGSKNIALDGMQIRRLTPTECERLQGFPDGWTEGVSDTQRYKCLGNAVTVNVIEAVVSAMLN